MSEPQTIEERGDITSSTEPRDVCARLQGQFRKDPHAHAEFRGVESLGVKLQFSDGGGVGPVAHLIITWAELRGLRAVAAHADLVREAKVTVAEAVKARGER